LNCCLERARDGDPSAVRLLVNDLRPRIYKMAAYYARCCGEDAEDLTQEAWLGLLEALPELDLSIGQPEQYLIARARWRILDTIKRERVRRCVPLDDIPGDAFCPGASDDAIESASVSEFVGHLKPTQRDVLACLLSGLTWREAGERLGCASANIAYHVRKIRRRYEEWI
jgi:RNA polymerase sigma factor (sigma-70 family)